MNAIRYKAAYPTTQGKNHPEGIPSEDDTEVQRPISLDSLQKEGSRDYFAELNSGL